MKIPLRLALGLLILCQLRLVADEPDSAAAPGLPPAQLEELLGPVALYPDALLALLLPAATAPADVVLAARYLRDQGDPAQAEQQDWEESVQALAHYPDVVAWMDENLAWTKQLGVAFLAQPDDVMNAVQRLRARARSAGNLVDTPQQVVVVDGENLDIVPAQPDIIYVPDYDPGLVYGSRPGYYPDSLLTFGAGYATGFWLGYDLDWTGHRVWVIDARDRDRYWRDQRARRRPESPGRADAPRDSGRRPWKPAANFPHPPAGPSTREPVRSVPVANPPVRRPTDPGRNPAAPRPGDPGRVERPDRREGQTGRRQDAAPPTPVPPPPAAQARPTQSAGPVQPAPAAAPSGRDKPGPAPGNSDAGERRTRDPRPDMITTGRATGPQPAAQTQTPAQTAAPASQASGGRQTPAPKPPAARPPATPPPAPPPPAAAQDDKDNPKPRSSDADRRVNQN